VRHACVCVLWVVCSVALAHPAAAQPTPVTPATAPPGQFPQLPDLPAAIARDEQGRVTVRAVRVTAPLRLDGRLEEPHYTSVEPISGFIQMEPNGGQPATEKTEVWLAFDQDNVYVSMRIWESEPERRIANEMRRDNNNIRQGDAVGFSLDTFFDRRNAVHFEVNALGARIDGQSFNERQYSADWNPVWDIAVGEFEGGWTLEAAVPFKSIRFQPGASQTWGIQMRRSTKWKNEIGYLTRVPPGFGMGRADFTASLYAQLVGIEAPSRSVNLEIKPYAVADLTTDPAATLACPSGAGLEVGTSSCLNGDFGFDAKYGVTQGLLADLTYNPDFAQVEADEQQVNLTRFSLFFPEKREFFLENQGIFAFGGAGNIVGGGGGGGGNAQGDTPVLFYSRRIGLLAGREVPIVGGGRLTGRAGRFSLGLLDMRTGEPYPWSPETAAPDTNFAVVRVKRDILRRSSIGAIVTSRSVAQTGTGSNEAYGLDGNFAFFSNLSINAYWAKTQSKGVDRDDTSYRAQLEYVGDRYGVQIERLDIGDNFNPEVGFVRRDDMVRSYGQFRFSPRPAKSARIRKYSWVGSLDYIEDRAGHLETRKADGEFAVEFQNSDRFNVGVADSYEFLASPFAIAPGVTIPAGGYAFATGRVGFTFGQQRLASANALVEFGNFYDGTRTSVAVSRGRLNLTPRFSVEPGVSLNWVDLPRGSFTTELVTARVTYTMTPLMFVSALLQYNSSANRISTNARFRWEYRPGSELFVVYNDERDSTASGYPDLQNRAVIVKINWLLRL
jgi:hypothetical protein